MFRVAVSSLVISACLVGIAAAHADCPKDPKILARELLELDLSGLRHPVHSPCLEPSRFSHVQVYHDPVSDSSIGLPELLEEGDRVEIIRVSAEDSVGGMSAEFEVQRKTSKKKERGTLLFFVNTSLQQQKLAGCAQLSAFPEKWRMWKRCAR